MLEADITVVLILGAEKNGKNLYSKIKRKNFQLLVEKLLLGSCTWENS